MAHWRRLLWEGSVFEAVPKKYRDIFINNAIKLFSSDLRFHMFGVSIDDKPDAAANSAKSSWQIMDCDYCVSSCLPACWDKRFTELLFDVFAVIRI